MTVMFYIFRKKPNIELPKSPQQKWNEYYLKKTMQADKPSKIDIEQAKTPQQKWNEYYLKKMGKVDKSAEEKKKNPVTIELGVVKSPFYEGNRDGLYA